MRETGELLDSGPDPLTFATPDSAERIGSIAASVRRAADVAPEEIAEEMDVISSVFDDLEEAVRAADPADVERELAEGSVAVLAPEEGGTVLAWQNEHCGMTMMGPGS